MGRYFGVKNITKNHSISSYWKGAPPSEIKDIITKFKWDKEDVIEAACYDTYCIYDHDTGYWEDLDELSSDKIINIYSNKINIAKEISKNIIPKYDAYDGGEFDSTFFMN